MAGLQEIMEDFETVLAFEPQSDPFGQLAAEPVEADSIDEGVEAGAQSERGPEPDPSSFDAANAVAPEQDETAPHEVTEAAPAARVVPRRVMCTGAQGQSRRTRRSAPGSLI